MDLKKLLKYPLPWIVQPKLNGERCRALITRGICTLLSSEENEITTLPHINRAFESLQLPDIELDGEIYLHGMSKQEIGSFLRRKELKEGYEQIQYHMFDLICNRPQIQRLDALWFDLAPMFADHYCLQLVEGHKVGTAKRLVELLDFYINQKYEGIIVRNALADHERKRTVNMLKWKPTHKDSYLIVGVEEEVDQYGSPKGRLGAIWCEKDGERFKISAGGFPHAYKQDLWEAMLCGAYTIEGKWLLIKYVDLTDRGVPNHAVALSITESEVIDET
jgi:ATP-dependent DNA ligase